MPNLQATHVETQAEQLGYRFLVQLMGDEWHATRVVCILAGMIMLCFGVI